MLPHQILQKRHLAFIKEQQKLARFNEVHLRSHEGRLRWFRVNAEPVRDPHDGRLIAWSVDPETAEEMLVSYTL